MMQINRCLTYATVCSGIECMSAACADLPMKPIFFSEIEPFPCAVLKSHFPNVPNLGDMSKIEVKNEGKEITNGSVRIVLERNLDIFAGGTPCQDVSVAGKRSGMQEGSGTRSSLAFEFVRLVRELKPRYVLWENVAGVLSDKSFPEFLTALANCGYGVAYRTLDAQWVRCADCYHEDGRVVRLERAIPQRRRRVWVVGCVGGDVAKAAKILFEHKSIVGDTPPRRRTGQEIAAASRGRDRLHDKVVGGAPGNGGTIALDGDKLKPRENPRKGGNGFGINEDGASYTLTVPDRHGVAYGVGNGQVQVACTPDKELCKTLDCMHDHQAVVECYENHAQDSRVRPIEVAPTIPQKAGTGGNNLPLAVFNKVSHARGKDGDGERWAEGDTASTRNTFDVGKTRTQEVVVTRGISFDGRKDAPMQDEVAHTLTIGSNPGFKDGVLIHTGLDGYNKTTTGEVAPTISGAASDIHAVTMVSTNSNGGDVMPTLTNDLAKQTGNQQAVGGGILSMNFEMYDTAEDVNVSICAKRARDCMVIKEVQGE